MKNLVMGVAKGYNWNDIEPFVNSFQKNCNNADLVLFMDNPSKFTENKLNRGGVRIEQIPENLKHMVVNTRWEMYENFLSSHPEYEKIFCTDIRDVIFQGDLFSSYADYKNFLVYATHPYKIQNEPTNTKWIRHIFSENEYQKIKDNFVICAGVVYGSRAGMNIFIENMVEILKRSSEWGDDQAVYNYLVRNNLLPIENLIESNIANGKILNTDYSYTSYAPQISENKIKCLDGSAPAVVHQWTIYGNTVQLVDNLYREKDFQTDENFTDLKSALERQNFNAATKFFINYIAYAENLNSYGEKLLKLAQLILQRYNPDAEILLSAVQKTFANIFSANINIQQMENLYQLFNAAEKNLHCVNPTFKNFVKNMLVAFTDIFYKNNQQNFGQEYIKRLADWRD